MKNRLGKHTVLGLLFRSSSICAKEMVWALSFPLRLWFSDRTTIYCDVDPENQHQCNRSVQADQKTERLLRNEAFYQQLTTSGYINESWPESKTNVANTNAWRKSHMELRKQTKYLCRFIWGKQKTIKTTLQLTMLSCALFLVLFLL